MWWDSRSKGWLWKTAAPSLGSCRLWHHLETKWTFRSVGRKITKCHEYKKRKRTHLFYPLWWWWSLLRSPCSEGWPQTCTGELQWRHLLLNPLAGACSWEGEKNQQKKKRTQLHYRSKLSDLTNTCPTRRTCLHTRERANWGLMFQAVKGLEGCQEASLNHVADSWAMCFRVTSRGR